MSSLAFVGAVITLLGALICLVGGDNFAVAWKPFVVHHIVVETVH